MKRRSLLAVILAMTLVLAACGGEKLVEVEIPKMVVEQTFGELTEEDVESFVTEEEGIKEAELKNDGVLVLKITEESHKELVDEMDQQVQNMIDQLKTAEEIGFIEDISHNKDYKEVKVLVKDEVYEENKELGNIVAGMIGGAAGAYQSYAKLDVGSKIIIENEAGDELSSFNYPDDLMDVLGF